MLTAQFPTMRYCLNPNCRQPKNPDRNRFCQTCGHPLLLKDRYRAVKCIGQGGFGRTFLGIDQHKPSQPYCVIKQFFPQAQGTNNVQKAAQLFEQEAVRLEELGAHPQIPTLHAHFTQDHRQYLVQEFIDGQNLSQLLSTTGPFDEQQIRAFLNNLLPVLDFIHRRQVIHRDIKPENIIWRENGELVLVDFGAAKYATSTALLKTGTTIGTPEYLAPEQGRGRAVFASDLYSLGVTCLHLLTGRSPFELFDIHEDTWIWRQVLTPGTISDTLAQIIDKLIASAINRRYQSAPAVLQDLGELPPSGRLPPPELLPVSPQWHCRHTLTGHSQWVRTVAIHPHSTLIASGSEDQTIRLWDLATGVHQETWRWGTMAPAAGRESLSINTLAFSPDGQLLASGGDDPVIYLWDWQRGACVQRLGGSVSPGGHSDVINAIAWNREGTLLVSASKDRTLKIWQLDPSSPQYGQVLFTLTGHFASIRTVSFSPDSRIIASGSDDNTIKLWQLGREMEFATLGDLASRLKIVNTLAFSPDGQRLASGGWDHLVKLWDFQTAKTIHLLAGHQDYVRSVAFSPDGQSLVSGSDDHTLKIWHASTGELLTTLAGHQNAVNCVAWSGDRQLIVSASADTTLKVWQLDSPQVQPNLRSTPATAAQPQRALYHRPVHQPWMD